MQIFHETASIQDYLAQQQALNKTIGFFPTMGALHHGHLSLLNICHQNADFSVCSIFVNPTQFNSPEDLANYPNTIGDDILLLEENGCDVLFLPSYQSLYQDEVPLTLDLSAFDKSLEGRFRPGHFLGVARVVKLLFDVVKPDVTVFGLKDFQQCMLMKALIKHYQLPIQLIFAPTIREHDGLAMSSRNKRLTLSERNNALSIYKALEFAKSQVGRLQPSIIRQQAIETMERASLKVEYFELLHAESFSTLTNWELNGKLVAVCAAYAGSVRLIDNLYLREE